MPLYFDLQDWIPAPSDWGRSIVQGKTYDSQSVTGRNLTVEVSHRIKEDCEVVVRLEKVKD